MAESYGHKNLSSYCLALYRQRLLKGGFPESSSEAAGCRKISFEP